MAENYQLISVRIDQATLDRLRDLDDEYRSLAIDKRAELYHGRFNRSALIRHALNTGLDFLNNVPPIEFQEPQSCQPSATPRPQTTRKTDTDSSARRRSPNSPPTSSAKS